MKTERGIRELTVKKERTVFADTLIIKKGKISDGKKTFYRFCIEREDAVAVFILNTESDRVILTRQFRYPLIHQTKEHILEIVAGKIEEGEQPLQTALRETKEETGYQISPGNISFLFSCFSTPGYSTERFYVFYATVTNKDKVAEGGGEKTEHEEIEVVPVDRKEFKKMIDDGLIKDAKTYLATMFLEIHRNFYA